jgi:asparagine synthase (glutamine-hydrolysing)
MPGIAGIISKRLKGDEEEKLSIMLDSMLHESFYTHGTYLNNEKKVFIAYVSIENSFSDCMPIYNETRDLVMFLTGECYFDAAVVNDLSSRHKFDPNNASFLIHLYEEQGEDFFQNLNGWYNGIILNLKNGRASLFNDRYGNKRIYYHEDDEVFIFSSEAKSLLKAFHSLRNVNPKSMGEYLVYDCVLENRTYFSDIFLLPQGSVWNFSDGRIDKKKFFDPGSLENQPISEKGRFFEELMDTFVRILPRYFCGKSIGMSLTGGLDTRMIMACRNPAPAELPCYTFGGKYRDILDVRIAPHVAKICNQKHTTLLIDDDKYLFEYPVHAERSIYISDGTQDVVMADTLYFNKLARQIAPVKITGKFGSQVLKGVFGFRDRSPFDKLIDSDFKKHLLQAKHISAEIKKGDKFSFLLFNELAWWWNGISAVESSQVTTRSPYLDNDLIKVLYKAPSRSLDYGIEFQLAIIKKFNPKLMSIPTTGTYGGDRSKIISGIVKNFLKFLIIIDKLYIRERLPCLMTHWVGKLDHLLSPLHADRFIMGFTDFRRYRVWYRDQLSRYLKEILLCGRTYNRPYWNRNYLRKIVNDHTNGRGTYLREIRKALQIELIHRVLIEDL